jgi:hypothetical protein
MNNLFTKLLIFYVKFITRKIQKTINFVTIFNQISYK